MDQTMYDNINEFQRNAVSYRLLKDISDDLDLPTDVVKRVYCAPTGGRLYVGSGEDFCSEQQHASALGVYDHAVMS